MKTVIICASITGLLAIAANAQNPNITWQTPLTISGTSDVSTSGTLVGTWGPGDDWGGTMRSDNYPVNGVTFAAYGSGPFGSWISTSGTDDRYGSYANPNTADSNYNYLLQTAIYSYGEPMSLTWGGMTAGDTYQLEFWVNDGRNSVTAERSETLTGGANTSAALAFGTGPGGTGPGQYILGTFVADSTGQETLTLNPSGGADIGASAQINLLQLRDITPVPEPSTLAVLAMGTGAMLFGFRRKNRAV
jgi:PEP-CTERM motif